MNYIFDVCLNFMKKYISFYEWNDSDNIEYYEKIPIFKIEENLIDDFFYNEIKVDNLFLKKICNKTIKYNINPKSKYKYMCILSSDYKVIALSFNDNGLITERSSISIEEASEILEFSRFLKYSIIDYKIIKENKNIVNYLTRKEQEEINLLNIYLNRLITYNNHEELEYIYYELYNEKLYDHNIIKHKLINAINNSQVKREQILKIYNIVCNE